TVVPDLFETNALRTQIVIRWESEPVDPKPLVSDGSRPLRGPRRSVGRGWASPGVTRGTGPLGGGSPGARRGSRCDVTGAKATARRTRERTRRGADRRCTGCRGLGVRHPMAPPPIRRQDALADEATEPPRGPAGAADRGEECEGLVRGHGRVRTGSERLPCASLEGVASARIRKDEDPSRDLEMFSEAERRRGPERPDALAVDAGVEGLARIFEEDQPMPPATFPEDLQRIRAAGQ